MRRVVGTVSISDTRRDPHVHLAGGSLPGKDASLIVNGHVALRRRMIARVDSACGGALVAVGHQVAVSHDLSP